MVTKDEKQEFSNRLNSVLDKAGIPPKGKGRQGILGKIFGVSDKGARKWIEGEAIPSTIKLPVIVDKFKETGVTFEWLLTGVGDPLNIGTATSREESLPVKVIMSGNTSVIDNIAKKVPLISWVSAGMWCEAIDNYNPGDAEDWLPCPVNCSHNTFALNVSGNSMTSMIPGSKTYPDRCVIYVDPGVQVTNGCNVIAKLKDQDEVTFKTYREDAGKKWLIPINPQYEKILIDENIIICGVVIGKFEPE